MTTEFSCERCGRPEPLPGYRTEDGHLCDECFDDIDANDKAHDRARNLAAQRKRATSPTEETTDAE